MFHSIHIGQYKDNPVCNNGLAVDRYSIDKYFFDSLFVSHKHNIPSKTTTIIQTIDIKPKTL